MKNKEKKYKIPVTFAVIPSQVRFCREISSNAKLLYGDIVLLSHQDGYCRASNDYLAFIYDVDDKTISEWVSQLKKVGFVKVPQLKGYERHIYPQVGTFREKKQSQENTTINPSKDDFKGSEKADNNNTSINNKDTTYLAESTQLEKEFVKEFNLEEEIKKLLGYSQYWLNIIGLYIKVKKINLTNKKQVGVLVSRFTKTAKLLEAFDRKQIEEGMRKCMQLKNNEGKELDWTLETVVKQLIK